VCLKAEGGPLCHVLRVVQRVRDGVIGDQLLADYGGRVAAVGEIQYWWHEAPVPAGLEITQVYGYLLCPVTCRVLVQDNDGVFNLPGGTPEPEDADLAATLMREAFEES
jgi:hypothetical protein